MDIHRPHANQEGPKYASWIYNTPIQNKDRWSLTHRAIVLYPPNPSLISTQSTRPISQRKGLNSFVKQHLPHTAVLCKVYSHPIGAKSSNLWQSLHTRHDFTYFILPYIPLTSSISSAPSSPASPVYSHKIFIFRSELGFPGLGAATE